MENLRTSKDNKKYYFEDKYFDNIDLPKKAYWLGFFYADGFIRKDDRTFGCALKEEDKSQLLNFLQDISINSLDCLRYSQKQKAYRFTLNSPYLVGRLKKIGFTSNKTYEKTLDIWNNIPDVYKRDFILGLWDGDGNFSFSSEGKQLCSLVSNNNLLLETISSYINSQIKDDFSKVKPRTQGDPYPRIRFTTNKAKIFGDWLYADIKYSTLQRKRNVYLQFKLGSQSHPRWDNYNTKGIVCLDSNNYYTTAKDCCLGEFGFYRAGLASQICATCRGKYRSTHGKHFRFMTEKEKENIKNGKSYF